MSNTPDRSAVLLVPKPPLLWPSVLTPENEIDSIKNLHAHLTSLTSSVEAWEAALLLFQTAQNTSIPPSRAVANRWRFLACNECVLELYHFQFRLEKIQSVQVNKCPSLLACIDHGKLRAARSRLATYFPYVKELRNAIAHAGQNDAHPEKHAPDGAYALSGIRDQNKFSVPYKGTLYSLDISFQSLREIAETAAQYFSSFVSVAAELERQGHRE